MEKKYLTIKEYADIRGVSVSSVYKRLNTTLKEYFVEVENRKMLKVEVLEAEGLQPLKEKVEAVSTPNIQPSSTFFEEQLKAKDKQIEALTEQIKTLHESNQKKDDFIQEQSKKLTELLEQSNILLQNNQLLLAGKPETKEKEEEIIADETEIVSEVPVSDDKEDPGPQKKVGWFKRIFG